MKKKDFIIGGIILVAIIILGFIFLKPNTSSELKTNEDITKMIKSIYKNSKLELPELETETIDINNSDDLLSYTGLKSNENVESVIVSLPLMNAIPYNLAVVKAKDGANIEAMKEEMLSNINMRRWVCVNADKLYITNNGNVIFLIMANEEDTKPIYEEFKKYVNNNIGKELEKTYEEEDIELPDEILKDVNE